MSVLLRRLLSSVFGVTLAALPSAIGQTVEVKPSRVYKEPTLRQIWRPGAEYIDAQHGVSFRYPAAWTAGTQFAYWPPMLTAAGSRKPIAGFGYVVDGNKPGPYQHTITKGFWIVYSAASAANEDSCEALATGIAETTVHTLAVLDRRRFSVRETSAAGMMQFISGSLYSIFANSTCYLFEVDEAAIAEQTEDDLQAEEKSSTAVFLKGLTPAQGRATRLGFIHLLRTIRIQRR